MNAAAEADVMLCALVAAIDPAAYVLRRDGSFIRPGDHPDPNYLQAPGLDRDALPLGAPVFTVERGPAGWWSVVVGPLTDNGHGARYIGAHSHPFGEGAVRTARELAHALYVARLAVATSRDLSYRR